MGKSTISMAMFNSYVSHYQRVHCFYRLLILIPHHCPQLGESLVPRHCLPRPRDLVRGGAENGRRGKMSWKTTIFPRGILEPFFLDGAMLDIVRLSLVSGFSNWCCQHLVLEFIVFEGFCLHALKDANNLAQDNSWSMTRFWKGKPTAEHLSKYPVCVTIIDIVKAILGPTE